MKKLSALFLATIIILSLLCGCNGAPSENTAEQEKTTEYVPNPLTTFEYDSLAQARETFGVGVHESKGDGTTLICYDGPDTLMTIEEIEANLTPELAHRKYLAKSVDTKISVNGHELFVYETGVADRHTWFSDGKPPQTYTPMTYFDFKGKVDITIDVSDATDVEKLEKVTVSPVLDKIDAEIDGQTVSFSIDKPGDYTVVFNDDVTNAVHIFASAPEEYTPDENDLVIGAGEWYLSNISLEDGQTLYIQGGAVVHSKIICDKLTNIKIKGRGILDGSHFMAHNEPGSQGAMVPIRLDYCSDSSVEGIIVTNPNCWVLNGLECNNVEINNVHIISARPNGDGITLQDCRKMDVHDCFVRSWDDTLVVKNYTATNSKDITFDNIMIWTDLAQSMEIGYETNKGLSANSEISDITFKNITVMYNWHKPVISIHNSDDALVHNITYKNIVVENANMGKGDAGGNNQLIDFSTAGSHWSRTEKRGNIRDVLVDGVTVLATDNNAVVSRIQGTGDESTVEDIIIKDLVILGEKVTEKNRSEYKHQVIVKSPYAKNVTFK